MTMWYRTQTTSQWTLRDNKGLRRTNGMHYALLCAIYYSILPSITQSHGLMLFTYHFFRGGEMVQDGTIFLASDGSAPLAEEALL